jgi:hypothetical protein
MNANSLVIGLTILFGVLGILGLVISLVVLEWTAGKRVKPSEDEDSRPDLIHTHANPVKPGARARSRIVLLREPELR